MEHHHSPLLPEGSTEAHELTNGSHKRGLGGSLGAILATVVAIVVAALIVKQFDDPNQAKRSAQRLEQRVDAFTRDAAENRDALRAKADEQREIILIIESAITRGESPEQILKMVDGDTSAAGLINRYDSYKRTLEQIALLISDAASDFHPALSGFGRYEANLSKFARANLDCLNRLSSERRLSNGLRSAGILCNTDATHFYQLDEKVAQMASCEQAVHLFLHDTANALRAESDEATALAEDATVFASFRRVFLGSWHDQALRDGGRMVWSGLVDRLDGACGASLAATRPMPSYVAGPPRAIPTAVVHLRRAQIGLPNAPPVPPSHSSPEVASISPALSAATSVSPTPPPTSSVSTAAPVAAAALSPRQIWEEREREMLRPNDLTDAELAALGFVRLERGSNVCATIPAGMGLIFDCPTQSNAFAFRDARARSGN